MQRVGFCRSLSESGGEVAACGVHRPSACGKEGFADPPFPAEKAVHTVYPGLHRTESCYMRAAWSRFPSFGLLRTT
ncbi:hypothetical protein LJK87_49125 [Paenibacillus sp. P25]|nr:hypothetical protein LJK87_49125 [Paenibacillus sp. P25]